MWAWWDRWEQEQIRTCISQELLGTGELGVRGREAFSFTCQASPLPTWGVQGEGKDFCSRRELSYPGPSLYPLLAVNKQAGSGQRTKAGLAPFIKHGLAWLGKERVVPGAWLVEVPDVAIGLQ